MRTLVLATVFASILGSAKRSTAEINAADSIEWITADSELVIVGRVTALSARKGAGETIWYRVTITVSDTLKGTPQKSIGVVVRGNVVRGVAGSPNPGSWKSRNAELLLFLTDWKRRVPYDGTCKPGVALCGVTDYGKEPYALHRNRQGDGAIVLDGKTRAYTSTFGVLRKRGDLIAAVRAAAPSTAKQALDVEVPFDSPAGKALYGGSSVFVGVPIDAALEQRAIGWLAATTAHERDRGVLALSQFKSPANIKRLEAMLGDPGWIDFSENGKPVTRRFFVRKRVHETLTRWGVPHTTPPIDTRAP